MGAGQLSKVGICHCSQLSWPHQQYLALTFFFVRIGSCVCQQAAPISLSTLSDPNPPCGIHNHKLFFFSFSSSLSSRFFSMATAATAHTTTESPLSILLHVGSCRSIHWSFQVVRARWRGSLGKWREVRVGWGRGKRKEIGMEVGVGSELVWGARELL